MSKTNPTALVGDDNFYNRDLCRLALEFAGYQVIEAANGIEILDILASQPVELLILDLAMPEMDGIGVIKALRNRPSAFSQNRP